MRSAARRGSTQSRQRRTGPGAPIANTIDLPSRLHARPHGSTGCGVRVRGAVVGVPASSTSIMRTAHRSGSSSGRNTPSEPHDRYASRRPSAENAGAKSNVGCVGRVITRGSPPSMGIRQRPAPTPSEKRGSRPATMCNPSGDQVIWAPRIPSASMTPTGKSLSFESAPPSADMR
jgi:hypothetical protein